MIIGNAIGAAKKFVFNGINSIVAQSSANDFYNTNHNFYTDSSTANASWMIAHRGTLGNSQYILKVLDNYANFIVFGENTVANLLYAVRIGQDVQDGANDKAGQVITINKTTLAISEIIAAPISTSISKFSYFKEGDLLKIESKGNVGGLNQYIIYKASAGYNNWRTWRIINLTDASFNVNPVLGSCIVSSDANYRNNRRIWTAGKYLTLSGTLSNKEKVHYGFGASSNYLNKTFGFIGVSISYYDQQSVDGYTVQGYQKTLQGKLGFNNYTNYAISGSAYAVPPNYPTNNALCLNIGSWASKDIFILEGGGTNDFRLSVPIGNISELSSSNPDNTKFYGGLKICIERCLALNPSAKIVLCTALARDNSSFNSWNTVNTAGHSLADYRQAVLNTYDYYYNTIGNKNFILADLYNISGITQANLSSYTADGLHPNQRGYELMGLGLAQVF